MIITKTLCDFVSVGLNKTYNHFVFTTKKVSSILRSNIVVKNINHINNKLWDNLFSFCDFLSHKHYNIRTKLEQRKDIFEMIVL